MVTAIARSGRRVGVVRLLLWVLAGAFAAARGAEPGRLLFVVPWGDGPGQLGFRAAPEQEPLCVQAWCLGPDRTFIFLDPVARLLKAFDSQGRSLGAWGAGVRGTSVTCDAQGTAFVLDGSEIVRVGRRGHPQAHASLPAAVPEGYGQGLRMGAHGRDVLELTDRGSLLYKVSRGGVRACASDRASGPGARPHIERGRAAFRGPGRNVDLGTNVGTVLPAGTDAAGDEYFEVERARPGPAWCLEVWILPADGEAPVRVVDTGPCDDVAILYRRIAVAGDGTIYRVRLTGAGLEVHRFAGVRGNS